MKNLIVNIHKYNKIRLLTRLPHSNPHLQSKHSNQLETKFTSSLPFFLHSTTEHHSMSPPSGHMWQLYPNFDTNVLYRLNTSAVFYSSLQMSNWWIRWIFSLRLWQAEIWSLHVLKQPAPPCSVLQLVAGCSPCYTCIVLYPTRWRLLLQVVDHLFQWFSSLILLVDGGLQFMDLHH